MKIVTFCCDLYSDIAPAYHYLWETNWPDCDYEMIYVTNSQGLGVPSPVYYIPGKDIHFGWRLRQFIEHHYTDEHLLIMMVDYLIKGVDRRLVSKAHELCALPGIRHVRLRPHPHPQHKYPVPGFGRIQKGSRYCLSLQPGIWETQFLYGLCNDKEDPFHTETRGSARINPDTRGDLLSVDRRPAIAHLNYYEKKRVSSRSVQWVRKNVPRELWPRAAKKGKR